MFTHLTNFIQINLSYLLGKNIYFSDHDAIKLQIAYERNMDDDVDFNV